LLHEAQINRAPIRPLTGQFPGIDVADAYAIQIINRDRSLAAGNRLVGHKIGLTSRPMQTLLGVDEPDFGYILDSMVLQSGTTVEATQFCAPKVEPELAFLLNKPLHGADVTVADVYAATEAVAVALEIVDSRILDWKLTLPDTVADNASSGAVVLGK
ncbi:MAG TPA: 2-keto-4-pentenoate hydratase, partial [Mycobacterium sp.]